MGVYPQIIHVDHVDRIFHGMINLNKPFLGFPR